MTAAQRLLFLSTPSARRATPPALGDVAAPTISIHALREEGDILLVTSPGREEPFLSTPSARRATALTSSAAAKTSISIHALREEGDRLL